MNVQMTSNKKDNQIRVKIEVNGTSVNFLVDTGANITIICPPVYKKLPDRFKPHLVEGDIPVTTADGTTITSFGYGEFHLSQGKNAVTHSVCVADIDSEGILGYDFLKKYECTIDVSQHNIKIN